MFNEEIKIERKSQIRYGQTEKTFDETMIKIKELLRKHNCTKIMTLEEGNKHAIAFELNEKPYVINIPKIYVRGNYNDKIGIRIIFRYLETLLELAKDKIVDFETLMLGSRLIQTPDGNKITLKDLVSKLPVPKLLLLTKNIKEVK